MSGQKGYQARRAHVKEWEPEKIIGLSDALTAGVISNGTCVAHLPLVGHVYAGEQAVVRLCEDGQAGPLAVFITAPGLGEYANPYMYSVSVRTAIHRAGGPPIDIPRCDTESKTHVVFYPPGHPEQHKTWGQVIAETKEALSVR